MKNLLSYISFGEGKPLVFLHGYLENKYLWKDFFLHFKNNNCIAFDLPGCGESELQTEQTIDSMATAVKESLDSLNINDVVLIGHSMGGYVALSFAEQYSNMLKGLVLLNSHPFADSEEKRKNREQEIYLIQQGKKSLLISNFLPKLYASGYNNEAKFELSRIMAELTCPKGMIACLKAMANRNDKTHIINNANFPILWIYGKQDQLFSAQLVDEFHTENHSLIKIKLNESGHMAMFEAEAEVVKAIKIFLNLCS